MFRKIIVILLLFSSFCSYLGAKEEIKVENRGIKIEGLEEQIRNAIATEN